MKTGSANISFLLSFRNFLCLIASCLLVYCVVCWRVLNFFLLPVLLLGGCVEVDVDIITILLPPGRKVYCYFLNLFKLLLYYTYRYLYVANNQKDTRCSFAAAHST